MKFQAFSGAGAESQFYENVHDDLHDAEALFRSFFSQFSITNSIKATALEALVRLRITSLRIRTNASE